MSLCTFCLPEKKTEKIQNECNYNMKDKKHLASYLVRQLLMEGHTSTGHRMISSPPRSEQSCGQSRMEGR